MNLDYVRVTDGKSGNAWTALREIAEADGLTILDGPAVDARTGRPLPPSRVEEPGKPDADDKGTGEPDGKQPVEEPAKPKTPRTNAPVTEPAAGK